MDNDQPTEEQFNLFVPVLMVYLQKAQGLSDEVREAHKQYVLKQKSDPQFKAEIEAETASNFEKADQDKDGKLNEAEFVAFMRLIE